MNVFFSEHFDMIYFNDFYCAGSAAFPAGRSLYKSTWAPYFFFISFFFGSILRQGIQTFFFLTAPPAAGIPTYTFLRPRKKQKYGHSFILFGEKKISNFIGYFSCFL
jgi:hypothetical protein